MQSWASEELKYAVLPEKRLNQRLIKIVENLAQQPNASIPQASGDWAGTKATYNFWKSSRVNAAEQEQPRKWLQIQANLGLAENTIQAYGKSLEDYLLFCKIYKVVPEVAKKPDILIRI